MLLADWIVSSDPSSAIEAADNLLNSTDTRDADKALYRHTVIALMSKFGGTFELRRLNWQGHCEPALEDFVLRAQDAAYKEQQVLPLIYTYHTQEQLLELMRSCSMQGTDSVAYANDVRILTSNISKGSSLPADNCSLSHTHSSSVDHEKTNYFQFWNPRIKSYFMHLRDTVRDLNSSSSPYER
ncbi:hypothetical protein K503DRAFT_803147 [Rhizopogon vinicolor AM-OR11-026]|uniref:Uncharacterized protein n=1 Tax=Rhizopogon vinicolor AM-OR11-026 TaxID=1314800 RepID=A0A1B7MQZ1_9AGAM|nr:hypothetical protein K503DRAFT_803147 [Rhizopogon vinicolor AM-OR11-026]